MIKEAQPANWQKILSGLRKITNLPPKVREYVNDPSRITFPQSASNSQAVAYVTNEDYNNDGRDDSLKVHIVVPTFNTAFGTADLASMAEDSPEFKEAIERIASVLIHEIEGHIADFNPNDAENPFKGGEAVAEDAERRFTPIWASSTINNNNKVVLGSKLHNNGDMRMKSEMIKLANHLDKIGHSDLADRLDSIIKSADDMLGSALPADAGLDSVLVDDAGQNEAEKDLSLSVENVSEEDAWAANEAAEERLQALASMMERGFSVSGGKVHRN